MAQAHYGLLRNYRLENLNTEDDIRGVTVYGRNGEKLGKIEEVIFDHSGVIKYVVVDAGASFSHKKFLVPAYRLHTSTTHDRGLSVNLDWQQVEDLPLFTEADLASEEGWRDYQRRFDHAWHSGPMQRK
jgi:sporulation protein YlmC with PRC-barrel domain